MTFPVIECRILNVKIFFQCLHNSCKAETYEKINLSKKSHANDSITKRTVQEESFAKSDIQRWKCIMNIKLFKENELKYLTTLLTKKIMLQITLLIYIISLLSK